MAPPGSVRLIGRNGNIISYPKPTDDYDDPLNWSLRRKAIHYGIILTYVGVTFAAVDLSLVGDMSLAADLAMDAPSLAAATSFRYVGLALAGTVFVPLAYKYGRRPVYLASLLLQLSAAVWTALVTRAWEYQAAGCLGGAGAAMAQSLVPMTVTDLFFTHQFATVYGLFVFAQGLGSFVGPILSQQIAPLYDGDWRWMPWSMAAAFSATAVLIFLGAEESTFVPNIDNQIAAKSVQDSSPSIASHRPVSHAASSRYSTDEVPSVPDEDNAQDLVNMTRAAGCGIYLDLPPGPRPLRQRFALATPTGRPIRRRFLSSFVILARFPGVVYAALTYGFLMAWLSLFVQVVATQLTQAPYNLDRHGHALVDLGPLLGHLLGTLVVPPLSDRWIVARARRRNADGAGGGVYEPEMRLWFALGGGVFIAAGILLFGLGIAEMIGDAMVGVVFLRNALAAILWIGIMPRIDPSEVNEVFVMVSVAASVVLLIPVPLLVWGRRGRAATASKYREYSLAATPPATLNKILGAC
ncbi:hypothetical protein PWT90_09375 [Aphanocladium album]|nr:hypothetical protein PWT90_09375 [Aphanocladium album]